MRPNRAILLTPRGPAAIAVIRLDGPKTQPFLDRHFSGRVRPGACVHGLLRDDSRIIDDPLVVLSPSHDWADISLHGGPWIVQTSLELAGKFGFEIVTAPADAAAAFAGSEAVSEIDREILAVLPLAKTELAVKTLLAQPAAWSALLATPRSALTYQQILADRALDHLLRPTTVAIVGPPNVGKSTLANRLFGQERSITADVPGTTRDWVGESANIDGLAVTLLDTPGVRHTTDPIESRAIAQSRPAVQSADLVVLVIDSSSPEDAAVADLMRTHADAILVANKSDRRNAQRVLPEGAICTNALTGEGVEILRLAIKRRFGCDQVDTTRPRCWTDRQRDLLQSLASQ